MRSEISFDLKPHLEDFLRHEFTCELENEEKYIVLNRYHDIGKVIISMIESSIVPEPCKNGNNLVRLMIPTVEGANWGNRFLHIKPWKQRLLQDYIQAEFNRRVRDFFQAGYKNGFKQKEIINGFLHGYNMRNNVISYEAVKKNDYRFRKKTAKEVFETIQSAIKQ